MQAGLLANYWDNARDFSKKLGLIAIY
ncbi:MAG: hypothetical protein H6Q07_2116, partial [Acidobacteria bacterium]|nr:hypothetical protein [Acidobacteriota bacterium]